MEKNVLLKDRSIAIAGPITSTIQSLALGLLQEGADVALIDKNTDKFQRFAVQLSDQREVNERFGRGFILSADFSTPKGAQEALSKVAQTFGGVDALVDATWEHQTTSVKKPDLKDVFEKINTHIDQNLKPSLYLTAAALPFFVAKKRGRIIFLTNGTTSLGHSDDTLQGALRGGLLNFSKCLSKEIGILPINFNVLSVQLAEEYLLGHFPQSATIKEALVEFQKNYPGMKITDSEKILQCLIYLLSSKSNGITGQEICVG